MSFSSKIKIFIRRLELEKFKYCASIHPEDIDKNFILTSNLNDFDKTRYFAHETYGFYLQNNEDEISVYFRALSTANQLKYNAINILLKKCKNFLLYCQNNLYSNHNFSFQFNSSKH